MKRKFLFLTMLLTLCAVGTMKAQSCNPINVTVTNPYVENFSTADWPHANTTNSYDLFSEYPQNCWHVPYTIEADGGTPSPRLWYNGEGNPRHISLKEGSSATQDQYVLFPVFSNPIKDLNIKLKANIDMGESRKLYIGYYDTETQEFTELKEVNVLYNSEYRNYGPYDLNENDNAPDEFNERYRLAFRYPGNADGCSCAITEITVGAFVTTINSNADWEVFCDHIGAGFTYLNRTVTLGSNIQISKMTGGSKSQYYSFRGTFNGQGHQLILNGGDFGTATSPAGNANIAPFRYVWGATIASLEVTGDIHTASQKAAGFVAVAGDGDLTFTNCRSSVNIHASRNGDGTHGGFIALLQGDNSKMMTASFTNCAFTGSITTTNNTTNVGGFVGWCEWKNTPTDTESGRCTLVLNNCVVAPNAPCISEGSKTFSRFRDEASSMHFSNCYYNQTIGDAQGKLRYTITGDINTGVTVAMAGDAILYNVSQITAYENNEGLRFNDTLWVGENDNVNLLLTYYGMGSVTSYVADQGTLTYTGEGNIDGTDDPYTLVMPASDVTIEATFSGDEGALTVCSGSTVNSYIPLDIDAIDIGQHTQMIYPASDLAVMAGKEINQMTFRVENSSFSQAVDLWAISLGVTEATTLSGFDDTTLLTQRYYGYLSIRNGVMTVMFDDPFYYPGGNLLVDFYHPERDLHSQSGPHFLGVVAENASFTNRYWTYSEPQDFLPQVTFDYRVATSTPKPSHLTVSDITDHSATVSWMAPSYTTPIRYRYDLRPIDGGSGGGSGVGAPTSHTFNTLREYTTYEIKVKAIYDDEGSESDYISTTFTTRSTSVNVNDYWEEDFENIHTNVWEFYNGYFTENAQWARGEAVNNGGNRSIYITNDGGTSNAYTGNQSLVVYAAKLLHFVKGKFTFSFDWRCVGEKDGSNFDYLQVGLVPGSVAITADSIGTNWPTGWVRVHDEECLDDSDAWQTTPGKTITVATTGDYYLVLRWRQDWSGGNNPPAAVDNIRITRMFCENDVTGLAASTFTSSSALLNWDGDSGISGWQVAYSTDPDFPEEGTTVVDVTENTHGMTNLSAGTTYYVKVRTHCSEAYGYGEWCNPIEVNTKCEYITQFPWKEEFETYNHPDDIAIVDFQDFCWVNKNITGNNHKVFIVNNNHTGGSYHVDNGNDTHQIFMPCDGAEARALLVLPGMSLPEGITHNYYRFALDIWRNREANLHPETDYLNEGIYVYASTDDVFDEGDRELGFIPRHIQGISATIPQEEREGYYNYSLPIGEWGDGPCYIILIGLTKNCAEIYMDNFEVSVIPNTFTNAQGNHQWSTAANWEPTALGIPKVTDNVEIKAEAVIPYDYVAKAHKITIKEGGSITMESGAQLWHANEAVRATVQKKVSQFTNQNVGDGFVFLGSPIVEDIAPADVENMFPENTIVDLYRFNQSADLEWENWKKEGDHYHFDLQHGKGYLYAHNWTGGDNTLGFNGYIKQSVTPVDIDLVAGWNLIGNPFVCNAYVDRAYYKMNANGSGITAVANYHENPIAPCTGIMVSADAEGSVTFSRVAPELSNNNGNLQIALSQVSEPIEGPACKGNGVSASSTTLTLDNAIVSFNEGVQLEKFYFGDNAKLYIPQGGKDYAITFSEGQGEMPLNFKATENGEYTISVIPEGVEMNYLHLIDNITGADVDLLTPVGFPLCKGSQGDSTPASYTFTAKTTDYESRFRLVFICGDANDDNEDAPFAFISNSNIIVNGTGTLQIIDILGRELVRKELSTLNAQLSTLNYTPGVYVLRLINGNDVKTQKIIIE